MIIGNSAWYFKNNKNLGINLDSHLLYIIFFSNMKINLVKQDASRLINYLIIYSIITR